MNSPTTPAPRRAARDSADVGFPDRAATPARAEHPQTPSPRGPVPAVARWCARHPLVVIVVWVLVLAASVVGAVSFQDRVVTQTNTVTGTESSRAQEVIDHAFPDRPDETDFVVVHSGHLSASDPAVRDAVTRIRAAMTGQPHVSGVTDPYRERRWISRDDHTVLVPLELSGTDKELAARVGDWQDRVSRAAGDEVDAWLTGSTPMDQATLDVSMAGLARAESIGLPIAAVVLLVAFGSVVAAVIPLAFGVIGILATLGVLGLVSLAMPFSSIAQQSVSMLCIALGIDYCLFIVTRFREEIHGHDVSTREARAEAVGRTMGTTGTAVLFSGTTVMISLAGLFVVRSHDMRTLAVALMVGILMLLVQVTTLLPAVLGLLGRRVNAAALPWARRRLADPDPQRSVWGRMADAVMKHPVVITVVTTAVLLVIAAPTLWLRHGVDTGADAISETDAGRGFSQMSTSFEPGLLTPIEIVVQSSTPLTDRQLDAVATLARRAGDLPGAEQVVSLTSALDAAAGGHSEAALDTVRAASPASLASLLSQDGRTTLVTVVPQGETDADQVQGLVATLTSTTVPSVAGSADLQAWVGGVPAQVHDLISEDLRAAPIVLAAVLGASFVLLLGVFRSLLLPLKAILMNLLSVGAAFGAVVWVFQENHGASLFGITRTGFIQVLLPLLTFAVAFGLSMDYEVFMLSRMREVWVATGDNRRAVREGLASSARVISSAALIMVSVFGAFVLSGTLEMTQLGFMLAVAVLIDATVVRLLLVPALMRLMGRWNWWFPGLGDGRPATGRGGRGGHSPGPGHRSVVGPGAERTRVES